MKLKNFLNEQEIFKSFDPENVPLKELKKRLKCKNYVELLFEAIEHDWLPIVKKLLDKGIDVNVRSEDFANTPLISAVSANNVEIVKFLLKKGADINMQNNAGLTPLHISCIHNNFTISKLLIDNGANINIKNADGYSPFDIAYFKKNLDIMRLLRKAETKGNRQSFKDDRFLVVRNKKKNFLWRKI